MTLMNNTSRSPSRLLIVVIKALEQLGRLYVLATIMVWLVLFIVGLYVNPALQFVVGLILVISLIMLAWMLYQKHLKRLH
jgi:lipopolysaccharide export LptBFGC system permease protein LptF